MAEDKKLKAIEMILADKTLQNEVNKPYYKIDYLDGFKLPVERLEVSAIIPTYNRSPYKPSSLRGHLNPLSWAINSLLMQKPRITEIIVVDDNSNDYTKEVVESFKKEAEEKKVELIYIKNRRNFGNALARHFGCIKANSKFLFFADDDCILPPYCVFGAIYTFTKLNEMGINIGAINLPTYFRRSLPKKTTSKRDIGKIDFIRGIYTTNKDAFPLEYCNGKNEKKFLDVELHVLEPFPINNFNTLGLCSKKAYQDVGGFKETIIKRGEDREFGCQLVENGYDIYFQPDIKFHCVHGVYGLKVGKEFEGDDWFRRIGGVVSLKKAMQECDKPESDSGSRIISAEYLKQAIISFFTLVYQRNKAGAIKWVKKVYEEFVIKGDVSVFGSVGIIPPSEKERRKMWEAAINDGIKFIKRKETDEIKKVERIFERLGSEKRDFEKALKMIAEV